MRRPILLRTLVFALIPLAAALVPSPAASLQEPPPPSEETVVDEPDPRRLGDRFFDPRLIGPGWLESTGSTDAISPPKAPQVAALNAVKVVAGFNHSCALTDAGGVRCWGDNYFGQLGDGTRIYRTTPVDVVGLTSGVSDIGSSHNHTCALTIAGAVKCWGYNQHGELGNGGTLNSLVPVDVFGLQGGITHIAVGGFHTCARKGNGGIKCWGANWHGQVGDGSTLDRYLPVNVVDMEYGTLGLAAGKFHTCGINQNRQVKCWGYNKFGQQGNGSTADNHVPKKAIGLGDGVKAVYAGGLHTCAWTLDDKVKCWGDNSEGQLGVSGVVRSTVPVKVLGVDGPVVTMSLGGFHTCALNTSAGVECWGDNWAGQLGNSTTDGSFWPSDVALPDPAVSVAGGDSHTCAATAGGVALCWGSNGIGQLGISSAALRLAPVDVAGLGASVSDASAGALHACALTVSGGVKCWGNNKYGQLGDGTFINRLAPVDVVGLTHSVVRLATGLFHTCAVLADGALVCWGDNTDGQLGDGTTEASEVPVYVSGLLSGVLDVSAGVSHTCALTEAGGVKCWGKNSRGRLGDGTTVQRLTPVDVYSQTSGVVAVEVGVHHSCLLRANGAVLCWGANYSGQLGDGTAQDRWTPVAVSGLAAGVVSMTAGDAHTCVLFDMGGASCWGANYSGQLGDGTSNTRYLPGPVAGLPGPAVALESGHFHTCAVLAGGAASCWGDNWNGQLGDGTTTERLTPTAVPALATGVSDLFGGSHYTCGLMTDSSLKCWGAGASGQLGDGATPWETAPVGVVGLTPASMSINYSSGQAGSFFLVEGQNFLPGSTASVTVNGYTFVDEIPVSPDGSLSLILVTDQADDGDYFLVAEGILKAMTMFQLVPDAPLRPQEGAGYPLNLPPGIGLGIHTYFPVSPR